MTAEEYARAKGLMCDNSRVCHDCPIAILSRRRFHKSCMETEIKLPTKCVEAVERWWGENKHRFPETEVKK